VTEEQYRTLLLGLTSEQLGDIAPVDASERARRGVEGLRKDVWPALRWGQANTKLLAARIEELKRLDLFGKAMKLAADSLPERVELSPHLYVVLGGRAGAAALDGDEIYFDILITSYRAATGTLPYPSSSQIREYFAHEAHHIGLAEIIKRKHRQLRLNNQEERAFSFLTSLVMEGSASYLINGHHSLNTMRRDPQFRDTLENGDKLLRLTEQVLKSVLENNLAGEAYEQATTPFLASGWHCAGALMLAAIDQAGGIKSVMGVLRDPRKLLIEYDRAVAKLSSSRLDLFEKELTERISKMGAVR